MQDGQSWWVWWSFPPHLRWHTGGSSDEWAGLLSLPLAHLPVCLSAPFFHLMDWILDVNPWGGIIRPHPCVCCDALLQLVAGGRAHREQNGQYHNSVTLLACQGKYLVQWSMTLLFVQCWSDMRWFGRSVHILYCRRFLHTWKYISVT